MNDPIQWEVSVAFLVAVKAEANPVYQGLRELSESSGGAWHDEDTATIFFINIGKNILLKAIYSQCPYPHQGGDSAAWQTTLLINKYNPYCVIMLGMCAGNKHEGLVIGDVVISSTVYRHDYAKIEHADEIVPRFEARGKEGYISVNEKLIQKLNTDFLPKRAKKTDGFNTKMGVIFSGCQIIKLANAHKILSKSLQIKSASGDGYHREMFGIDMEAYSVAYASKQGKCNWIVIKGVSDFGEPGNKIDGGALKAVTNAFSTTIAVIQDAVIPLFIQETGRNAISEAENTARDAYYEGDIDAEKSIAEKAFQRGVRTAKIRRRLLHGLLETDRFDEAERICSYLESTKLLYDGNTAEYVAQMLSRKGRQTRALEIVNNFIERNNETIQLLYIGASNSYQIAESTTAYDHAALICDEDFKNSICLVETAIARMEKGRAKMPWLYVFGYFLYAIKARYNDDAESNNKASIMKTKASAALEYRTSNHPNLAAAWFQRLLFLAMTKERASFDGLIVSKCGGRVSWTRLDSAFMRLESLRRHSILTPEEFDYYWSRLCQWVAQRAPRYGRPAQSITNKHLDDTMRAQ